MHLLPCGGYLATCSCSHFTTQELLLEAIQTAAHHMNVQLRQIELHQQAPNHPIGWGIPEIRYLDFLLLQVVWPVWSVFSAALGAHGRSLSGPVRRALPERHL